ncbi:hypothetical protein OVA06_19475 [Pseudarthrobacter sp. SL88]|uniref:hypothetical protein n=1 Tax=Pseudarthrobacter sp. SL88 TaxID=2994666 RepID=UPI002273D350|nr:hypothetical protein [Pseudarthrobacter sp. SL88]MCY1676854.1 hypothetical protein [Pseudarthrobacter sp. SL88]
MPTHLYRSPVPEQLWNRIRDEFTLPTLEQVRERFAAVHEDPEPATRQLIRVFIDEETYCPGFQFHPDLSLNPVVVRVFERAMELRIPHNYFALWMMVRSPDLHGRRPVDLRNAGDPSPLLGALGQIRDELAA